MFYLELYINGSRFILLNFQTNEKFFYAFYFLLFLKKFIKFIRVTLANKII